MFKKLIVTLVILATATTAMARDITVTFADGSKHQYNNAPDSVTPEQVMARVSQEFPNKTLVNVDGGKAVESESIWPTVGKIVLGVLVIGALGYAIRGAHASHPCVLPTDRASNGSLCGGRASSVRPGGA
jgi:hypothetical protein